MRSVWLRVLVLLAIPALLLVRPLFLGHDFVPFDLSIFPPASVGLTPQEIDARRASGNHDITEKTTLCVPEYRLAREELVEGRFPHWNPWVRGGAPLFANGLCGMASPLHWPFLIWSPERAFGLVAWLAFALAGLFMLGFLRDVGLEPLPALFGAVVFQLSGTLAANAHFFMRMETLVWLPAGFWALERLSKLTGAQRVPPFACFAVVLGLVWLSGFPPYALAVSLAFGLYVLTLGARAARTSRAEAGRLLAWSGAAIALGVLIAAVQLVPLLDYYPEAQRDLRQDAAVLASQGLDPLALLGLLMPAPFGSSLESSHLPYDHNPLIHLLWSRRHPETGKLFFPANYVFTEYVLYLGVLPLACAFLALLRRNVRFRLFAVLSLVLFLALAMGDHVFRLVAWLPVFQSSPPMRLAGVVCFFAAALAAMGFQNALLGIGRWQHRLAVATAVVITAGCAGLWLWARDLSIHESAASDYVTSALGQHWMSSYPEVAGDPQKIRAWFDRFVTPAFGHLTHQAFWAMIGFGLATLWLLVVARARHSTLAGWTRPALVAGAFVLALADLGPLAWRLNPSFPQRGAIDSPVHAFLRQQRVALRAQGGFTVARAATAPTLPIALPPNLLVPEQVRDLNAYAFLDGRSWRPFRKVWGEAQMLRNYWLHALPADERTRHPLLDLFGVRYLLAAEELPSLGTPALPPLRGPGGQFFVYQRPTALPRAFLVPRARLVPDDAAAIEAMAAPDFAPRAEVMLHDQPPELFQCSDPAKLAAATVEFASETASEVRLLVRGSPGAWLVLTDTAMSHWLATLNGGRAPWQRADLCFRALWVPAGEHEVAFRYDATPFRTGLALTALALGSLLALLSWWTSVRKRPEVRDSGRDVVDTE